jgi:hypothetical protein
MTPRFWKLSHGAEEFSFAEFLTLMQSNLACMHKNTAAKGGSRTPQGEEFLNAEAGDYFYLTYGNQGIYLLGQFIGPVNIFSRRGDGWVERDYRVIRTSILREPYTGQHKRWSPVDRSTFIQVPPAELQLFEQLILKPYFDLSLQQYGIAA